MRRFINAASEVLSENFMNFKTHFIFTYQNSNGDEVEVKLRSADNQMRQFLYGYGRDIAIQGPGQDFRPEVKTWLQSVFLNACKRSDPVLDHHYGFKNTLDQYLNDYVADIAFGDNPMPDPAQFGTGERKDMRFANHLKSQLPEWAQTADVLFPYSLETFFEMNQENFEEGDDRYFNLEGLIDYFNFVLTQGGRIDRMSVSDAIRLSTEWHSSDGGKKAVDDREGHDTKVVLDFEDGFKIVRLLTPQALQRETAFCKHCVGRGGYDEAVLDGSTQIYSLRNAENSPQATLEVKGRDVKQVKGYRNGEVGEAVRQHVIQFIIRAGLSLQNDHSHLGTSRIRLD